MSIVYDSKFKRIIFTKRDLELKQEYKNKVTYSNGTFKFEHIVNGTKQTEYFTEQSEKFFDNKSFTISYSPLTKSFTSFFTWQPNYYIPNQNYFSSGINYPLDNSNIGLYNHLLTNRSFQVFYGNLHPFMFEFVDKSTSQNKTLDNVEYIAEFRRFQSDLSSSILDTKTFNKALIYNQNQTSGLLNLVVQEKDNLFQMSQYPKQNTDSISILTENIENIWGFNNFSNIATENSGIPVMTYENVMYKNVNLKAISYNPRYIKDLLRSDFNVIRLINDKESNYQILNRFDFTITTNSNT